MFCNVEGLMSAHEHPVFPLALPTAQRSLLLCCCRSCCWPHHPDEIQGLFQPEVVASIYGDRGGAGGTQHLAESGLSVSSELIFVQFPYAILHFINVPMCQSEYSSGRWTLWLASADTDSAFSCAILETYSLQCSFHCSPTLETAAFCEIHLAGISVWTEPFLLQTWHGYQHPKFPAKGHEWADESRGKAWCRCALGEETPRLSRKQKNLPAIYL